MAGKFNKKAVKSRIKREDLNPIFYLKTKKDDDNVLTQDLIKSSLKSGNLNLSNRGLSLVPERVWNLHDAIENDSHCDFGRTSKDEEDVWWNRMSLKSLDLSSNVLTMVPKDIQSLLDLTVLNVSFSLIILIIYLINKKIIN
jgi:hypothetical protein